MSVNLYCIEHEYYHPRPICKLNDPDYKPQVSSRDDSDIKSGGRVPEWCRLGTLKESEKTIVTLPESK
jgi:hypothetical protein